MSIRKTCLPARASLFCLILGLAAFSLLLGCASSPKSFDPAVKGPQMMVEPATIRLGVATLMATPITFRGKGFQPGDSVFIKLLGVYNWKDAVADVPIADGEVDKKGNFVAKVGTITKVSELLKAKLGSNEKMENVIIVTRQPIPEGVYTCKAVSMESDKTAVCKLEVAGPSLMDGIKDWLGGVLGKIKKK